MTNVTAFPPSLGTGIKQVSSDPPSPSTGQIWFNTTTSVLKQYVLADGTWATGGNMNTARRRLPGAGIQTAALVFGGIVTNAPAAGTANTESYDGSSWTEVNNLPTATANNGGAGTATTALTFGGRNPSVTNATYEWNVPSGAQSISGS